MFVIRFVPIRFSGPILFVDSHNLELFRTNDKQDLTVSCTCDLHS